MTGSLYLTKIFIFLIVSLLILVLFIVPGFLLRKSLNVRSGVKIRGSLGLDFSLGYSIMLIPGLVAFYGLMSWTTFLFFWFALLATIAIGSYFFIMRKHQIGKLRLNIWKINKPNYFELLAYAVLIFTFIILFIRGGHFIGDHQHHLAYIIKLLHNDIITPWVPMYEGSTEIPYNYAYDINFLFTAVLVKLSGVNLNLYWDISPALYFIVSFSAFTHLYKSILKGLDTKKFYVLFVVGFIIYQLINWDRKLDVEFMPIPDQFARNIFLPLIFALFIDFSRESRKDKSLFFAIPLGLLLASIIFTHIYSYMVIIFILGAYVSVGLYSKGDVISKVRDVALYAFLMIFSLILFSIRTINSTFSYYSPSAYGIIEKYFPYILIVLFILSVLILILHKPLAVKIQGIDRKVRKILAYSVLFLIVIGISFFIGKNSAELISSVPDSNWKYKAFVENYSFPWFMTIGLCFTVFLPFLSFLVRKKGILVLDRTVSNFFYGNTFVILFASIPAINIFISKFVTSVYSRRFLYLHEVYFGFVIVYISVILFTLAERKLSNIGNQRKKMIGILLFLFLFLLSLLLSKGLLLRLDDDSFNRNYILQEDNVFDYIRENVEPWSVIASYKYAAMDVVAQTPNFFVSSQTVHSPKVFDEGIRQLTTNRIFSANNELDFILEQLSLYDCNYILTEYTNDSVYSPKFNLVNFNNKILKYPESFQIVFYDSKYILYIVTFNI